MGNVRKQVQGGVYSAQERARQYKREKLDPTTQGAQERIGRASGEMASGFETAMQENAQGVGDFFERNTRSLPGRGGSGGDGGSDTAEANYSSSSTGQSKSGVGKKAELGGKDRERTQGASKKLTKIKKKTVK